MAGISYRSIVHHSDNDREIKTWMIRQCTSCGRFLGKHHSSDVCHRCSDKHQKERMAFYQREYRKRQSLKVVRLSQIDY